MMDIFKLKKLGLFAGGVLFGTAGVGIVQPFLLEAMPHASIFTSVTPDFVHVIV